MTLRRRDLPFLSIAGLAAPALAQYGQSASNIRAHLGLTENPFGPSPAARAAIADSIREAAAYVHSEAPLVARIAVLEGVAADQIGISSGALESLSHFAVALGRGKRIVAPRPTYSTHLAYAERQGVETDWVPLTRDHQIDLDAMLARVKAGGVGLVYICNPNNPTGLLLPPDSLRAFCKAASALAPVMIDEAYFELAPDPAAQSMASLVRDGADVIVQRTFSKVYGLAGFRVAYALGPKARIDQLKSLVTTSRNQAGVAAATASLGDEAYLKGAISYLKACRARIYAIARTNRLAFLPSEGTYVYLDCGQPAAAVQKRLAARGVEVRLFDGAAYANWMRVGTATPAELDIFAMELPEALKV